MNNSPIQSIIPANYQPKNMAAAFEQFTQAYPTYAETEAIDQLRATDYSRLDEQKHIYLDYTGGGLYAESQIQQHMTMLSQNVFGNPHSNNPTSVAMTNLVEGARKYVLEYFNASPDEYIAIFTPNASGALKLVGESYPFQADGRFLLAFDNHNSVNGIREFARTKGATVDYVPLTMPNLRIDQPELDKLLAQADPAHSNLFAYPAQSNFSGVQHPLELIDRARDKGWDVLVDCAAFAPTNRLDIGRWLPDYATFSFYKMFGFPTGIGCLLARKSALQKLNRPWFAGGTITLASTQGQWHHLAQGEAGFEDGTVDYLNIPGVKTGLQYLEAIDIDTIHERVTCLSGWLLQNLYGLRHQNGKPLVRVYGPTDLEMRGGTVTVNFYDPSGNLLDYRRVEELANEQNISIRTGCFCNPGANEIAEALTEEDIAPGFEEGKRIGLPVFMSLLEHSTGKSAGAVRISVGLASNFADVYRFLNFAQTFLNKSSEKVGHVTFEIENCRVIRDGS
ncbi:aminotransferase class V-fold PLP-dependent enzyme [Anaerolineales bacterium HSG6]|nr:aminotransferase class V-fold PLP-dependent enzyme [Anaerolineales bacterium HSG6]